MKDKLFIEDKTVIGLKKESIDLKKLRDNHSDLVEYFGMPIEEISRQYWQEREGEDRRIRSEIENATSEEKVLDYYVTRTNYIYTMMHWESQRSKQAEYKKIYMFCKKNGVKRLLDYGAGVGGLCIYMHTKGIECDYLDVFGEGFKFARRRFQKRDLNINMIDALNPVFKQQYDVVVAYDVFEHLFDLDNAVKYINRFLKPGGVLISRSTFSGGGIHLTKNEKFLDMKVFDDFLNNKGFMFVGQLKADRFSRLLNKLGLEYYVIGVRIKRKLKYGGNFLIHKKINAV